GDGSGRKPRKESIRQPGVAVVECKEIDCLDLCRHDSFGSWRSRSALIESIETRLLRRLEGDGRRDGCNGRIGPSPDSPNKSHSRIDRMTRILPSETGMLPPSAI